MKREKGGDLTLNYQDCYHKASSNANSKVLNGGAFNDRHDALVTQFGKRSWIDMDIDRDLAMRIWFCISLGQSHRL